MTTAAEGIRAVYGVLGFPAGHSLSPAMHRAAFAGLGMNAEYLIFEKRPEELEGFLQEARRGIRGFNVTIPYKEQIIPFLDYVSPDARAIGAVNTVKVSVRRLEGFNTDGQGFMDDCAEKGIFPPGLKVCVLGAGGASRAVCAAVASARPAELAVYNRDGRKAAALIDRLREHFPKAALRHAASVEALGIGEAGLLVNATSLGMRENDPLPADPRYFHPGLFIYDLVYAPRETELLKAGKAKGCRTANGLGMLLHQGMRAFEIWTGVKPPRTPMERALAQ